MGGMPFPLATLPTWMRDMVEAVAASAQADVSMTASAALGVVSASVGRKGFVRLGGRRFPFHLWMMAIGESGDGKSTVFDEVGSPLRAVQALPDEAQAAAVAPLGRSVWERLRDPLDGERTEAEPPRAQLSDAVRVVRETLSAAGATAPSLLLDDITPTALIDFLGSQTTGSALFSPEGGIETWLAQGGAVPSQDAATLNRAWDGDNFTRRRQDRTIPVVRPAITMLVGMQPDIFTKFASHPGLRSRGFTLRFLFVRSQPRRRAYPAPAIDRGVRESYDAGIYRLVSLPGWPPNEPVLLEVSDAAAQLNADFLNRIEARIDDGGDLHHGRAYAQRCRSNLPRIAGLLHLARHAGAHGNAVVELPIDTDTMTAAVEIADYFLEEGVAALSQQPASSAGMSLVAGIERLLAETSAWVGAPERLVAALEGVVPVAERSGWPHGTNNITRTIREHRADLNARGIAMDEHQTNAARIIMLSRTETPREGGS